MTVATIMRMVKKLGWTLSLKNFLSNPVLQWLDNVKELGTLAWSEPTLGTTK